MVSWGSVDSVGNNWGGMDGMGNWSVDNWGMDSVGNWGVDGMSHNWGSMDSMGNWGMGNHMGWANMWGKVTSMSDNTSVADSGMVSNIRGRGSGSKAEEGGNDESLHFC